jgi:hypothetical protein
VNRPLTVRSAVVPFRISNALEMVKVLSMVDALVISRSPLAMTMASVLVRLCIPLSTPVTS